MIATEEQDQSWCHTVGYLSPLVVGLVLAARFADATDALAVRALLDVAMTRTRPLVAASLAATDRLVVAGSGRIAYQRA